MTPPPSAKTHRSKTRVPKNSWLKDQIHLRGFTQEKVARRLGVHPATMNLLVHGKRKVTPEYAIELAQMFSLSLDEFLTHIGYKPGSMQGKDTLVVRGWVDGGLGIHWEVPKGSRTAPRPQHGVGDNVQVLRFQTQGSRNDGLDGGLIYFAPKTEVDLACVGRVCVAKVPKGQGADHVCVLRRGYQGGTYNLLTLGGELLQENVQLESASPVIWMKI